MTADRHIYTILHITNATSGTLSTMQSESLSLFNLTQPLINPWPPSCVSALHSTTGMLNFNVPRPCVCAKNQILSFLLLINYIKKIPTLCSSAAISILSMVATHYILLACFGFPAVFFSINLFSFNSLCYTIYSRLEVYSKLWLKSQCDISSGEEIRRYFSYTIKNIIWRMFSCKRLTLDLFLQRVMYAASVCIFRTKPEQFCKGIKRYGEKQITVIEVSS